MFEYLNDLFNYENRKVARNDFDWGVVSTARVSDGLKAYETGICHPDYKDGDIIIVESYNNKEDAQIGHDQWVQKMTTGNLPDYLEDVANCKMSYVFVGKEKFFRKKV